MKVRKVNEYQTQCHGCGALLRIDASELDFSRGFADQRLVCPVCGGDVVVLRSGMIPSSLEPKIYQQTWEKING